VASIFNLLSLANTADIFWGISTIHGQGILASKNNDFGSPRRPGVKESRTVSFSFFFFFLHPNEDDVREL
jgi:hypothetical protein